MTEPSRLHEAMLELLATDKQLAIALAHAAAGRELDIDVEIEVALASFELVRVFDTVQRKAGKHRKVVGRRRRARVRALVRCRTANSAPVGLTKTDSAPVGLTKTIRPFRLYPDLVLLVRDKAGNLLAVWIFENQLAEDDDKPWRLPAYRASAQLCYRVRAEVLAMSPSAKVRAWFGTFGQLVYDPPFVLDLEVVTRTCNPAAIWLVDRSVPAPELDDAQLEREIAIARARPHAALFHAAHHVRNWEARQVVLAAVLAAHDLGVAAFERYTAMILQEASDEMNQLIHRELSERFPDFEISEWEREGAGFKKGLAEGLEQGRSQGLEQGRSQGLEQGRSQGLVQGRAEGLLEGRRTALFDILEVRGFALDPGTRERIEACVDADLLDRWRTLAKHVESPTRLFELG